MKRRYFGGTDIELSEAIFGTSRLNPKQLSRTSAERLLLTLVDGGVTSFHSSHEYETHPFFCDVLAALKRARPQTCFEHVVKLASPHFDGDRFDPECFEALVDAQLRALRVDRLDVVQWLVRHSPNEDSPRLNILVRDDEVIARTMEKLKDSGKIGCLTSFPYSPAFGEVVHTRPYVDGFTTYLNPIEREMCPFMDTMARKGQGFLAIRPLAAGRLTPAGMVDEPHPAVDALRTLGVAMGGSIPFMLRFPLLHPAVSGIIVAVSRPEHADQLLAAMEATFQDRARFIEICDVFQRYERE